MKLPKYQWLNCFIAVVTLLYKNRIRYGCIIINTKKLTYHFAGITRKGNIVHFVMEGKPTLCNSMWFRGTFEGIPRRVVDKLRKRSWFITFWRT